MQLLRYHSISAKTRWCISTAEMCQMFICFLYFRHWKQPKTQQGDPRWYHAAMRTSCVCHAYMAIPPKLNLWTKYRLIGCYLYESFWKKITLKTWNNNIPFSSIPLYEFLSCIFACVGLAEFRTPLECWRWILLEHGTTLSATALWWKSNTWITPNLHKCLPGAT